MPRLYFTDPIKALYMMREFGVRFLHPKYDEDVFIDDNRSASCVLADLEYYLSKGPLIVSPSAEHIFEPKEGDHILEPYLQINVVKKFGSFAGHTEVADDLWAFRPYNDGGRKIEKSERIMNLIKQLIPEYQTEEMMNFAC